uniref:RING-type domain-containing protein n=1 Tax=Gopherus evgoodei TaxID=1825980 RepID=A0A8C4YAB8_9SAUR
LSQAPSLSPDILLQPGWTRGLRDELTCSICLEYFKDPVSLDCDHNFCQACITQCWEGLATNVFCPQCRVTFPQRNLRLNRQLRNIVEAAKELRLPSGRELESERLCEKHKEPLKLFCKEDKIPISLVCDRSKEAHTVVPLEEAAQELISQKGSTGANPNCSLYKSACLIQVATDLSPKYRTSPHLPTWACPRLSPSAPTCIILHRDAPSSRQWCPPASSVSSQGQISHGASSF